MKTNIIKDKLKLLIKPLIMITLIITAMYFFGWYALIGLILFSWANTWKKDISIKQKLIKSLLIVIKIGGFILILRWLGKWGALGWIISVIILSIYKIWINNSIFMDGVKDIEKMIWGKTANERHKKKRRTKSN